MLGPVLIVVPQPRLGCPPHHSQPGLCLHSLGTVVHPEELARWLRAASTDGPPLVVLAGQPRGDTWLSCALDHANALVIPAAWFRGIPRHAHAARARLALRLARTHLEHPVRLLCAAEQTAFDF